MIKGQLNPVNLRDSMTTFSLTVRVELAPNQKGWGFLVQVPADAVEGLLWIGKGALSKFDETDFKEVLPCLEPFLLTCQMCCHPSRYRITFYRSYHPWHL